MSISLEGQLNQMDQTDIYAAADRDELQDGFVTIFSSFSRKAREAEAAGDEEGSFLWRGRMAYITAILVALALGSIGL